MEPVPSDARPVYEPYEGRVVYSDTDDILVVEHRPGVVARFSGRREGYIWICTTSDERDVWMASHPLLTLTLLEALKRRGLYGMHAACVASDGRGVLIAGTSGSGKTTLSIALTQAGFDFLGDDLAFLVDNDGVVGFADEIDITPWTEALFPALGRRAGRPGFGRESKRSTRGGRNCSVSCRCPPVLPLRSCSPSLCRVPGRRCAQLPPAVGSAVAPSGCAPDGAGRYPDPRRCVGQAR